MAMGRYTDMANEWLKKNQKDLTLDGHQVKEIIWETSKVIVFRDEKGKVWRRVHAWGMTWPIEVEE
jgi:hypothetical protein